MEIEGGDANRSKEANKESDSDNDVVEDSKQNEDEMRLTQKVNSIDCIEAMRVFLKEELRFDILLCRMIPTPIVCPSLDSDIKKLETEFVHEYRPGASVFYVSVCNENVGVQNLAENDMNRMSPLWKLESISPQVSTWNSGCIFL